MDHIYDGDHKIISPCDIVTIFVYDIGTIMNSLSIQQYNTMWVCVHMG
jgi:hypothetical protein